LGITLKIPIETEKIIKIEKGQNEIRKRRRRRRRRRRQKQLIV
jgi:hypothetical protein